MDELGTGSAALSIGQPVAEEFAVDGGPRRRLPRQVDGRRARVVRRNDLRLAVGHCSGDENKQNNKTNRRKRRRVVHTRYAIRQNSITESR